MPKSTYDLAIVGSSFAGSLLAILARRLGWRVLLLERGRHPRFVIGESSTPLANLLLEELADRYELAWLRPFSKWGTWQDTYPEIPCGLKRGFSFLFHEPGQPWQPSPERARELLVAASPHDALADTHWFRPDFDAFFVRQAEAAGVEYVDQIELGAPFGGPGAWDLIGEQNGAPRHFRAAYLVDASGPRGWLARAWPWPATPDPSMPPTQALFSHFTGVGRWEANHAAVSPTGERPPFPPDDAALHHVFPGGWMWVLRFNNGVTSAGCAVTDAVAMDLRLSEGAPAWSRLLARFPSVAAQFQNARPVREFTHVPRLSYRAPEISGPGWCLLPGTAGFIDPLLSTGFILNLLGIERLMKLWTRGEVPNEANYGEPVAADLSATAGLVAGLYRTMADPESFRALSHLYFAAASFSESARRLGRPELAPGFLLREHSVFAMGFRRCLGLAGQVPAAELNTAVQAVIAPFDVAGLTTPGKRHWYGCDANDLFANAAKLHASPAEISAMLARVGFTPAT